MRSLLIFLPVLFLGYQCQNTPKTAVSPEETAVLPADATLPPDFLEFYKRFHSDSLYQISHISWPLQGDVSEQIDSTHYRPKANTWTPETWTMMRLGFSPKDYLIDAHMLSDIMVIERIRARAVNYGLERRFAKQPNGEWELIFYSDVQERGK
ncbi:MAG: hypothetical protein ABIQ93_09520 [Saprospiraceae bacterium]